MNPKKTVDAAGDDDSLGVLDDAASLDTTGIGILGATAQVSVDLPQDEDDDLDDEGVVEGEVYSELVVDESPILDASTIGRIQEGGADIVIELPAAEEIVAGEVEPDDEDTTADGIEATVTAEVVLEPEEDSPAAAQDATTEIAEPAPKPRTEKPAGGNTDETAESATVPAVPTEPVSVEPASAPPASAPVEVERTVPPVVAAARAAAASGQPAGAPSRTTPAASVIAEKANTEPVSTEQENAKTPDTALAPRAAGARSDVALTSKRLGELGEASRETADLLTADRLLDPNRMTKPEPEGAWSHFLYTISGRRINIGDGKRARARKDLSARIAAPLPGGARFVPVLSRKGGVGKTTITTLLGMALADARDDRVIAVDANPDRGTLADRIVRSHTKSVRDLVRIHEEVKGYHDISAIVARDATRLDVLASDSDPRIADAFSDSDYRDVAGVAAHYYSLVLTDTGTGIVHSVMEATLDLSDQLIIVSGLSVDEARLASETLTWLETNGYAEQAREAIIVLNQSTPGSPLVRLNELEAHFATRAKHVVRMPYDSQIAGGGAIVFTNLQQETRQAARELAALLVEGLRTRAA